MFFDFVAWGVSGTSFLKTYFCYFFSGCFVQIFIPPCSCLHVQNGVRVFDCSTHTQHYFKKFIMLLGLFKGGGFAELTNFGHILMFVSFKIVFIPNYLYLTVTHFCNKLD